MRGGRALAQADGVLSWNKRTKEHRGYATVKSMNNESKVLISCPVEIPFQLLATVTNGGGREGELTNKIRRKKWQCSIKTTLKRHSFPEAMFTDLRSPSSVQGKRAFPSLATTVHRGACVARLLALGCCRGEEKDALDSGLRTMVVSVRSSTHLCPLDVVGKWNYGNAGLASPPARQLDWNWKDRGQRGRPDSAERGEVKLGEWNKKPTNN